MADALQELKEKTKQLSSGQSLSPPIIEKPAALQQPFVLENYSEKPRSGEKQSFEPSNLDEVHHSELSLISLILGILGLVLPLFSTLAVIFGIGGLMQCHRGMKGKWMAVLGIILGFLAILAVIAAIVFGISFLESYLLRFGGIDTLIGKVQNYIIR